MNKIPYSILLDDGFPISHATPGLIGTYSPVDGARAREYSHITNVATVGAIEKGTSYNCAVDATTGVWAGRDVADICWLEKLSTSTGLKEFWYAPVAVAGTVPNWTKSYSLDMTTGLATGATPAQFDNTTKLATTAFVRSAGMHAPISSFSVTGTIPATTVGGIAMVGGASPTVQTLPLLNSVPVGSRIEIVCTYAQVTIQRNGADNIQHGQSYITSFIMQMNDTAILEASGGAWAIAGGSVLLRYSGDFTNVKNTNGYQKLPSGLIIQWGSATGTTAGVSVTFPIAFPSACPFVGASAGGNISTAWGATSGPTTTGFTLYCSATLTTFWLAIGY